MKKEFINNLINDSRNAHLCQVTLDTSLKCEKMTLKIIKREGKPLQNSLMTKNVPEGIKSWAAKNQLEDGREISLLKSPRELEGRIWELDAISKSPHDSL